MGHPHYKAEVDGQGGTNLVADATYTAPRLSKALLEAKIGQYSTTKTKLDKTGKRIDLRSDFENQLKELLEHIEERLKFGLHEAWFSEFGYDLQIKEDQVASQEEVVNMLEAMEFSKSDEECWARAFTELVLFSAYAQFENYHHSKGIAGFLQAFPKTFPIMMECQDLSTLCILSRGFPAESIHGAVWGLSCSAVSLGYKKVFDKTEKFECGKHTSTAAMIKFGITPGGVVCFNPGGPEETTQDKSSKGRITHMATALRVSGTRIQFIDTGICTGKGETSGEGGTVDHAFNDGTIQQSATLCGVGGLKPAPDLKGMAEAMKTSRPLGFARLVIADVSGGDGAAKPLYVSKLLHMRYPVSRLIWSLRGLPLKGLSVLWYVYAPESAKPKKSEPQDTAPRLIEELIACDIETITPAALMAKREKNTLMLTNVIRGHEDGKASVYRRKRGGSSNGFILNFTAPMSPPKDPPEMLRNMKVGETNVKLEDWLNDRANFDKRWTQDPSSPKDGATASVGSADANDSGVAHFDAATSGDNAALAEGEVVEDGEVLAENDPPPAEEPAESPPPQQDSPAAVA
ncbi:MAG: hypothetical protein U0414_00940 [Polyangiaceae bacterium]